MSNYGDISRLMLEIEPGQDLLETLVALAAAEGWPRAFVQLSGRLDLVEVALPSGETEMYESVDVLTLSGHVDGACSPPALKLHALFMTPEGLRGGELCAAMTGKMLLVVDAPTDRGPATVNSAGSVAPGVSQARPAASPVPAAVTRPASAKPSPRPEAGRNSPRPYVPGTSRAATKPLSQSFSTKPQVQKIARKVEVFDDDEEIVEPQTGEWLAHPQLGLCAVVGEDDSGGVRVRVRSGHVRVLRLDALHVAPATTDEEGRRVYKILGPRRR